MKVQRWLSIALAVQLVLALGIGLQSWRATSSSLETVPFMDVAVEDIDRVVITDGDGTVTLSKPEEQWLLGENASLPAGTARVEGMLDSLSAQEIRYPVGTSRQALTRFEVAEESYQRHLKLFTGDSLAGEYYFGSSPAFGQVHARSADDDVVYAIDFNVVDLPADRDGWLDRSLLSVAEPRAIQTDAYRLAWRASGESGDSGASGDWQLVAPATLPGEPDPEAITALVDSLRNLRVQGVNEQAWPEDETVWQMTVETADGDVIFELLEQEDRYLVRRTDDAESFRLDAAQYRRIAVGLEELAPAAQAADGQGETETVAPGADAAATDRGD